MTPTNPNKNPEQAGWQTLRCVQVIIALIASILEVIRLT